MTGIDDYHGPADRRSGSNRRTFGRVSQRGVICDLGIVIDLSAGGMRVLCTKRRKGAMHFTLRSDDASLSLCGEVVWSQRVGFRRHLVGVRFGEMQPEEIQALTMFATSHTYKDAI